MSFSLITGTAPRDEQGVQGAARIEVAAALLGVAQGQQNLRHGDLVRLQQLLVGVREANLADRRSRLTLLEFQLAGVQPEMPPAERDRARGHQDHLLAALAQARDVRRKALQPCAIEPSLVGVDQQRGAHLDDDALGIGQAAGGGFAVGNVHLYTILPFT